MEPNIIKELMQYGALGVMAVSFIAYVWWNAKNTAGILREKDEYIKELNDKREETATKFQVTVDGLSAQLAQLLQMIDRRTDA